MKLGSDALTHFGSGVVRVGEGKNFVGASMVFANEAHDALDKDRGLAGTGAGDYQHGPVNVLDGLALPLVGLEGTHGWRGFRGH